MIDYSYAVELKEQELQLYCDGSLYWKEGNVLMIADVHLGKTNHFRKNGLAVPLAVQHENFRRLALRLERTEAMDVFFLGDLFHSRLNKSWDLFTDLLNKHTSKNFHLVVGNHDTYNHDLYGSIGMEVYDPSIELGPFTLRHDPLETPSEPYIFCGHLHPSVRFRGKGQQMISLKCFHFTKQQAILPAFGSFNGNARIKPKKGDRIFAISEGTILERTM